MVKLMNFKETILEGVIEINPFFADDIRGNFIKDYSDEIFKKNNIKFNVAEIFYTKSKKGVVRGLHFQRVKQQQKLIRCIEGCIFDVIVDLRKK